ncbi:MAG: glycine oxidase ThiO [Acidobacteriota bacterium]|nr:glycine oxidase ThiO [Acidobacteriota bacterium]
MSDNQKQFDAAIVGGGVIGCAIAWRLAQGGMRVAVIERSDIGREASFAAGGMLVPLAEADEADDLFHLCVASRAMYADFAHELQQASGINVEYRTEGTLYLSLTEHDDEELERRWQWQHAAGLNVKRLNADCARKLESQINPQLRWALKFPDDHQINNRLLIAALHTAARNAGVEFQTQTEIESLLIESLLIESRAGRKQIVGVRTSRGEVISKTVIVAAGSWSSLLKTEAETSLPNLNVAPVHGQMIAVEMPSPAVNHTIYSCRAYVVPRLGGFVIAGSTSDKFGFEKRVTAGGMASIIERAKEILPGFADLAVTETWSGLRPRAADGLPVIGADDSVAGLVYATGHYRNGILLTPITAQAISEIVLKGESGVQLSAFSPQRFARLQADGSTP